MLLEMFAPLVIAAVCLYASGTGTELYKPLCDGARKGLKTTAEILPPLIVLFPAIYLLRASGLPELLSPLMSGLFSFLGIPEETALLVLIRPISGSGALSAASDIIQRCGADSLAGRTAAVMTGSSETTFYVIAVYFSAAGEKESHWAIPAALCADAVCFVSSAWICRILWG